MLVKPEKLHPGQRVKATHAYPERGVFCPAETWVWEGTVEEVRPGHSGGWAAGWIATQVVLRDVIERTEPEKPASTRRRERMTLGGFDSGTTVDVLVEGRNDDSPRGSVHL